MPIFRSTPRPPVRSPLSISPGMAAVQTGIAAAIVGGGGYLAFGSAADLYRSRQDMANQFQEQLEFPIDLIQPQIDRNFYMSFKFMKYQKRSIQNSPFLRSQGSVRLPIPDNIKDNMSVGYSTPSLGPAVGAMLDSLADKPIAGADMGQTLSNLGGAAAAGAPAGLAGFATQFVDRNTPAEAKAGFSNYFGMAINPYQTVLFEKPEFKSHNFSWKIMPRNEAESGIARNIFRTFQYHMSPGISGEITAGGGSGLFFSYPSMVIVSLFPSSAFMYRFKPCVLKSVNVNYAAGSAPSFFKRTNAPTAMTISIQLQEIEYWTNKDFTGDEFDDNRALGNAAALETRQNAAQINQNAIPSERGGG